MRHGIYAPRPLAGEIDAALRPNDRSRDRESVAMWAPDSGPVGTMLGLQRLAGNAAVVSLLQRRTQWVPTARAGGRFGGVSTAPVLSVQAQEDEEWATDETGAEPEASGGSEWSSASGSPAGGSAGGGEGAADSGGGGEGGGGGGDSGGGEGGGGGATWEGGESESAGGGEAGGEEPAGAEEPSWWWPFGGEDESAGGGEGGGEGGEETAGEESAEEEHSPEDMAAKEAEGEIPPEQDVTVPMSGGPQPYAAADAGSGGFHDGGRVGTAPFAPEMLGQREPEEHQQPHAFLGGGRTGTAPWSGGGPNNGPHGNQGVGSLQTEIEPKYDTAWGGIKTNADAWVIRGTGIVDVARDYVSSKSGDQGNGWWVSPAAAGALETHEQKHIQNAKGLYGSYLQPMLDRVADSANLGKGKTYYSKDARAALARRIGWEQALKDFKSNDTSYNGNNGQVDTEDIGQPHYPRPQKGPRSIGGKEYDNYLIMGSEPDPT
jgi:hypothetical protein